MSRETARKVLEIESEAIRELIPRLDETFDRAVETLHECAGRVVVTGMGKSGLIGQKISATLSSTGTPSLFLHPAEATHGDLGRIVKGDVLIALSNSGDTEELLALASWAKRLGSPLVALTGNPRSALAQAADVHLDVATRVEACPLGLAPTASTTAALAMGDALSMALLEKRGFTVEDFAVLHPGGRLGKKLLRVEDLMHTGDAIGDLRRLMEKHGYALLDRTAAECMTQSPILVGRRELATAALDRLETRKITSLLVTDDKGRIEGVLHLHDLWKTEMI
jgi:arabinose-5-phosphate isomerase